MKMPFDRATVTLPADNQIHIERRFQAPAALVWRAWTTPELVARWWSDDTMPIQSVDIDLRPGGSWRYVIAGPDGSEMGWHGTFREVEPTHRLVSTEVFEGFPDAEAVNTLTLAEANGVTTLSVLVQHSCQAHRDGHLQAGMEPGMQRAMDRIEGILTDLNAPAPKVVTCLWFRDQAEEAARFYTSLLADSAVQFVARPSPDAPAMMVGFTLGGVAYQALNGARQEFNETASISVTTRDQAETDRLWSALTAMGGAESMCGWCRDRYGVSWQVVPQHLPSLIGGPDRTGAQRAMQAMLKMRKIDVAALEAAYAGG